MARTLTARLGPAAAAAAVPALTAAQVKAAKKKAAEDIKTFLEDLCSFKDESAEAIVDDQGYSDLDELCRLDDKGADNLCSILRKSQTGPAGVVAGHSISNLAQERLKLAIFALKHQKCMSREIDFSEMSKESILALDQQRQMEKTFTNKLDGYSQATFKDLTKTFEVVSEQIEHGRGIHGVCLAYAGAGTLFLHTRIMTPPRTIPPSMPR
jgi:hypothetical protein